MKDKHRVRLYSVFSPLYNFMVGLELKINKKNYYISLDEIPTIIEGKLEGIDNERLLRNEMSSMWL